MIDSDQLFLSLIDFHRHQSSLINSDQLQTTLIDSDLLRLTQINSDRLLLTLIDSYRLRSPINYDRLFAVESTHCVLLLSNSECSTTVKMSLMAALNILKEQQASL
jgi:hypothetical protein